jgi:ferritin-like metal-binding protein YciE
VGKRGDEAALSRSGRKIVQYLNEAYAAELGFGREMRAQIAATPPGRYRTALERHARETDRHAERLSERLAELDEARGRVQVGIGAAATLAAQLLSIGKVPLDLVRGSAGVERVLKNAKDACAAEALEIATYTALERLAKDADDRRTAKLAAWIRADEEAMLKKLLAEIPALTDAVARASFDIVAPRALPRSASTGGTRTGGGNVGARGELTRVNGRPESNGAVHPADGAARQASAAVRRSRRAAGAPRATEPWPGYDELTAVAVIAAVDGASRAVVKRIREYERSRKNRSTVIQATERELARS